MEFAKRRLAALSAEFDVIEANLSVMIEFSKHCHAAYLKSPPNVRRMLNQAYFEKIYVYETDVVGEQREPFRSIHASTDRVEVVVTGTTGTTQLTSVGGKTKNPRHGDRVGGLRVNSLVGAEGLEPPASAM
jgi:hypothetical protein